MKDRLSRQGYDVAAAASLRRNRNGARALPFAEPESGRTAAAAELDPASFPGPHSYSAVTRVKALPQDLADIEALEKEDS